MIRLELPAIIVDGVVRVAIVVNGEESDPIEFDLEEDHD